MAALSESAVTVPLSEGIALHGDLAVPPTPAGVVVFAHGSGSSRHSPRNRQVAAELQRRGLATLLVDLLTRQEERSDLRTGHLRFDIGLLARRLAQAARWTSDRPELAGLQIGYFGASTGAEVADGKVRELGLGLEPRDGGVEAGGEEGDVETQVTRALVELFLARGEEVHQQGGEVPLAQAGGDHAVSGAVAAAAASVGEHDQPSGPRRD